MVHHSEQSAVGVRHQDGVYLVSVHYRLYVADFGLRGNDFRRPGHYVAYCAVEELCLPFFHCTPDVAVGYQTDNPVVDNGNAKSQLSFAHMYYRFAQVHLRRDNGQVVRAHHIARRGQQALT